MKFGLVLTSKETMHILILVLFIIWSVGIIMVGIAVDTALKTVDAPEIEMANEWLKYYPVRANIAIVVMTLLWPITIPLSYML